MVTLPTSLSAQRVLEPTYKRAGLELSEPCGPSALGWFPALKSPRDTRSP